jgi:N4-gp56 family major capsid protein
MPGPTSIPFGSVHAVKRWSGALFLDTNTKSYWARKFIGEGDNFIIQRLTDLQTDAGDTITFDLSLQLRELPTYGDNRLEGSEESLRFAQDSIKIDQMRKGVSAGGKMSRKRTIHNIRKIGRDRLSDYWAKFKDEMYFIYLSGARGINQDFIETTAWVGHAQNSIQAPDAGHQMYGGDATSKASIDSADKMSRGVIEKAGVKAAMIRASNPNLQNVMPVMINGEAHYVTIMSKFQSHDMRTGDTTGWLDMQKAAAAAEGRNNPIFKGGLGMLNNIVLHEHESVIRFNDYGATVNLPAARALFLGRQAGVEAWGNANQGSRFDWSEIVKDHGNEPTVASGCIVGVKKTRFNGTDYGVIAIDTYAADPNP